MVVHVKEAVVITPSEPTPSRVLSLSSLDSQLFLRFTIEYLFIYLPNPSSDQGSITAHIKSALARALVRYYPLAGRVRAQPDGSGLEVVCRAQGAVFIEAKSDHSHFEFQRAPRYVTQWRKLLSLHVADVLRGAPPLVVQLTWLSGGAAAVGVGISHCICDGIGSAEFLNSFAELTQPTEFKLKHGPVWERHLLNPVVSMESPRSVTPTHPEFDSVVDLSGLTTRFAQEPLTPTSITFDGKSLNKLKTQAESTRRVSESSSYTCFEVLSAHVWRSWVRALNLPTQQTIKLLFSVNIRNRVKPNLPNGYYGNGFVLGCAQTTVKELVENGLGFGSGLVKRAKERVGDEYVREVVELVSESEVSPDSVGVLVVSQWSRLGLERVDFGMGKAVHVGPICSDRYCLLLPVYEQSDAVKVMVAVPKSAVAKYEHLITNP